VDEISNVRVGYDSTSAHDVPADGDIYPAYVDGAFANYAAMRKRFPHKIVPRITVNGSTLDAEIIDRENGDASAATAARWAYNKHKRGEVGTIYVSESAWAECKAECAKLGLKNGTDVVYWIAWYADSGSAAIPAGAIGRQFKSPDGAGASVEKGHYDVSHFRAHWPGVDPEPKPAVKVAPPKNAPTAESKATDAKVVKATKALSGRTHPVKAEGGKRKRLAKLRAQITRVLNLKPKASK
jgi:hypothetical protein